MTPQQSEPKSGEAVSARLVRCDRDTIAVAIWDAAHRPIVYELVVHKRNFTARLVKASSKVWDMALGALKRER